MNGSSFATLMNKLFVHLINYMGENQSINQSNNWGKGMKEERRRNEEKDNKERKKEGMKVI